MQFKKIHSQTRGEGSPYLKPYNHGRNETSASEFRAIVQCFTGRKRSSTSSTEHQEINSYSDAQYCPQVKAPKLLLEDELDSKYWDSAMVDDNVTAVNDSCNNTDHHDVTIFKELEVLPLENPDYIVSPQVFDTVESLPETTNILFDIFSVDYFLSLTAYRKASILREKVLLLLLCFVCEMACFS